MTKGKAAAWLICFALMLLGPGAVYFFARPYLNTENTENRQLAEMPALSFDGLKGLADSLQAFPSLFNSFYNDHVPFRSQLIELNSVMSVELFGDSASDSVVLGKDNWLFYTDEESIEDYKGNKFIYAGGAGSDPGQLPGVKGISGEAGNRVRGPDPFQ